MGKHNNFRLDEEKVKNAFADFSPAPDEEQWSKLEQSLEILGVQRRNSFRQKIQRTAVFSGLILLGASLVAFININTHQAAGNEKDLNAGEEVAMGDCFYSPSLSLNMKRTVSEVKPPKLAVDTSVLVQTDSTKATNVVSANEKSVEAADSSASDVKKQTAPTEPKKKKKRKKRKRKPASHNPSDDEVIIN